MNVTDTEHELYLRSILEPNSEYWSKNTAPFAEEIQQQRKHVELECHQQKYYDQQKEEDGDDKVFILHRRNSIE